MTQLSPAMQQYMNIKNQYSDCILFFRLGDFYEMFFEDAKIASEELDLVLTGKNCGLEERAPMCGVPFHSCDSYIAKLVERGYKVAICEQTEDPATAKGIVRREVVRVVTPGTVFEDTMLDESKNNYLASIAFSDEGAGVCFVDASTNEVKVTAITTENMTKRVIEELARFSPSEIISTSQLTVYPELKEFLHELECVVTIRQDGFDPKECNELVLSQFNVLDMSMLGLAQNSPAVAAIGGALKYLYETRMSGLAGLNKVTVYTTADFMRLDITAIRNLELCQTLRTKAKKGSLLWVIDKTKTAMGKRMIRGWLEQPLINMADITVRQNAVDELCSDTVMRGELTEYLTGMKDIERLITRVMYKTAGGRELNGLAEAAARFPLIKQLIKNSNGRFIKKCNDEIDELQDIYALISEAIDTNPSLFIRDGGIIREGYNADLDRLRAIIKNGSQFIADIEAKEKERTGIKNLKVRYNKVFGYYIEVTNSFLDKVPDDYVRRQTLTGGERFITQELKQLESEILGAKESSLQLEAQLFEQVRQTVAESCTRFLTTAAAVARLDCVCSLATVATNNDYCRPQLNTNGVLNITEGRHPVVEQLIKTPFVSNDTLLDNDKNRCAIITGPNMAGKSTYMRQIALIVIMAQMGGFVPAAAANIGIVDAVYTRVGASDDLAAGQSTFMVEMSEVAQILTNATKNSLLIFDEIGRGTSTFDGMSIARAVLEYVADKSKIGAKTLFATHYHELTQLEDQISGVKNYNTAVKKHGDDITFLRRIVPGGADQSYGIAVAKLSGVPNAVIARAKQILQELETSGITTTKIVEKFSDQLPLETAGAMDILKELKSIDANTLTPIEALGILHDIITKAKKMSP